MAKNYTFSEAVEIIAEGKDIESIADIGRRYPIMLHKVTKVATLAGSAFTDLMGFMPEYLTANKVNSAIKSTGSTSEKEDEDEDEGSKDTKETKDTEDSKEDDDGKKDYESMSGKQLWDILGKAGKRKLVKSTKKADLVEACKMMDSGAGEDEEDEDVGEEEEAKPAKVKAAKEDKEPDAVELFKKCKKLGLKVPPKKPAKFYEDAIAKSQETKDEDEDWDEDEAKEEKKPAKPAKAAKAAKPAKGEDDSGDDDWDI